MEQFRMNGFDVQPHQGVKVTVTPADGQKRGASGMVVKLRRGRAQVARARRGRIALVGRVEQLHGRGTQRITR